MCTTAHFAVCVRSANVLGGHQALVSRFGYVPQGSEHMGAGVRTRAPRDALHVVLTTGFSTGTHVNPNSTGRNKNQEQTPCAKAQENPSRVWYETLTRRRNELGV